MSGQFIAELFRISVGQGGQALDVPNEVRQAKLLFCFAVSSVCRKEITDDRAVESLAQDFLRDFAAAAFRDLEKKTEKMMAKRPQPRLALPFSQPVSSTLRKSAFGVGLRK